MNNTVTSGPDRATIFDVAQMAGVSIKTVSRVANGEPKVSAKTRSHVQHVIDTLAYRANPYASYLGSRRRRSAPAE